MLSNLSPTAPNAFISGGNRIVSANQYSYAELAEIYNQARVDYIVPMPMNAKRMKDYIEHYDIDLVGSVVGLTSDNLPCGVGMLGLRGNRAWITRLGVIPERRQHRVGQALMEAMLHFAKTHHAHQAQLEVIVGNDPARRLFDKLGFYPTRELLVIRRAPKPPASNRDYDQMTLTRIDDTQIASVLATRKDAPSWIEETASLLNTGNMRGFYLTTPDGKSGWIIFQRTPFQLTHFVLHYTSNQIGHALLYHVHKEYPMQDTKIENVDIADATWHIFQDMGYLEVFRRTEMFLDLK